MRLSYCIPCHRRLDDLLQCMDGLIIAANASPPVEIVIVDYGDQPSLEPALAPYRQHLHPDNTLVVREYRHRPHYHMAHARNLTVRVATGEYLTIAATDIVPHPTFFQTVRTMIANTPYTYIRSMTDGYIGVITIKRDELIAAGGFDERFEFYGTEDKELNARLNRRGAHVGYYDLDALIRLHHTPKSEKYKHYRVTWSRRRLWQYSKAILLENEARHVLVANAGQDWGSFAPPKYSHDDCASG